MAKATERFHDDRDLDMDDNGILRGPDGSDFILDEDGILRPAPNGRVAGDSNVQFHAYTEFVPRGETTPPSSASGSQEVEDWPPPSKPLGILKKDSRRVSSPANGQLTQDIDYCGPVPNNTQELEFTQAESQINSQSQNSDKNEENILDIQLQQPYVKSSSSETQEERDELNQTLRYSQIETKTDAGLDTVQTTADISLSDDDVAHIDLNDLERYAELEIQNGNLSNESQKTPATLPTIFFESGDQYVFQDDSREIDRSASSLHLGDVVDGSNLDIMDEDVPVFTGASIPFGESCEEVVGSDALIEQHARDALASKDDSLMTQAQDIPHSLIEFEALEVQMQIQNQMEKLKEEEDVLGDFLQSTETQHDKEHLESSPDFKGDSLPFENTAESDDLKKGGDSPSRIPVAKRKSLTKGGSLRSSTDSLSSAQGSRIPKKIPSPSLRGRLTPQKKEKEKENRRPQEPKFRKGSLNLKYPNRSNSSTPQSAIKTPPAVSAKKTRPVKAGPVPSLELDSLDDSDIEKVKTNLKTRLESEKSKRKQQQDVIKQLQEDYDRLLTKFALAEVTIDQLRLGAKMNLYTDSPTPQPVGPVQQVSGPQHAREINIGQRGQGQFGNIGQGRMRGQQGIQSDFQGSRPHSRGSFSGLTPLSFQDYDEPARFQDDLVEGSKGESIKLGLMFQTRSLSEQMESFQMLLDEDELNTEEQEKVIDKVKVAYDKLQADYRQAKYDSHLLKQHNLLDTDSGDSEFDSDKVIEGELFRLGMKLDDLQQNVEENMRISKRRTPFQDVIKPPHKQNGYTNGRPGDESSATDMEADPLDSKWQKLQKDYTALLDLFDRMKQLPKTPERDRDIGALMKKLKYLHSQSPNRLRPLPKIPDSDDDTLEGSMFGSTSSVIRATPKNSSVVNSEGGSSRHDRDRDRDRRRSQSRDSLRDSSQKDGSQPRRRHRSRSSYHDSDHDRSEPPKAPRPTSGDKSGADQSPAKKDQSDKDGSSHSRSRLSSKKSPRDASDDRRQAASPRLEKVSVRPVELDRDSGFIGSESSRHSQTNVSKRAQNNMSTLTDEDESATYPYKPSGALPGHLSTAPPTWTDSELSSAVDKPATRAHRTQKRSTTSVISETTSRPRKSSRNTDSSHRRSRRDDSEPEVPSTGRASIKSEKLKSLENEIESLKEIIKKQAEEKEEAKAAPSNREPEVKPWQHSYPWIEDRRGYARPEKVGPSERELPQTWEHYPYSHRPRSLADSDVPSLDTLNQSQPRRRSVTSEQEIEERRLEDKNRYNRERPRGESLPRARKPRDLPRERERGENEESRTRRSANREPRSKSVPRRLNYDTDDSPTRDDSRMRSRDNLELRRDAEKTYGQFKPRDRYRSHDNLSDDVRYHDYDIGDVKHYRHHRYDDFEIVTSPDIEPLRDHEQHYKFFQDLEKGRQHIEKVLQQAAEKRREKEEKERKEKRRQPVIVQGPGTLTKTVTKCCPMCHGKGECTHTEIYHLPQFPGHLGMNYAGMSQIPVHNGDIRASVEQNVAHGPQPVPGMQPPGGVVPESLGHSFTPSVATTGVAMMAPTPVATAPRATPVVQGHVQTAPAPIVQQPVMASTPYAGGEVRPEAHLEETEDGPVIKIPLRLYENRRNIKYMVKEFSDDTRSVASKEKTKVKKSKPRSSSVPPKDSARSSKSRVSRGSDDEESVISSVVDRKVKVVRDNKMNDSLDQAMKLAADLKNLSGKMKKDVKNDLSRSARTEHVWKTTDLSVHS